MSVQVRRRREAASFLATYVGAQGELLVDTTNNRVQVHDGATPGGWPAAKLADIVGRTAVADANYVALVTDRTVAITVLTAARTVTLPASATYPTGTRLVVLDETGVCSTATPITVASTGTDLINGATAFVIGTAYALLAVQSNGAGKWTIIDRATAKGPTQTILTSASGTAGSGTYTTPLSASWLRLRMIGGGGGGGGSGGSPGSGMAGAAATFGTFTASGGSGAVGATGAGNVAAGTSGDINIGGNGGVDGETGVAGMTLTGGPGGATPFAGGGRSRANGLGGNGPPNSGAGGGGAGIGGAATAGGGGAAGGYLEKIVAGPAATYTFSIGAAAPGGSAGSSGFAGGSGAAGLIIVEEHYD